MSMPLDDMLKQTLEDYRLSRGEKRALSEALGDAVNDPRRLNVVRSRVFDIARQATSDPQSAGVIDWLEEVVKLLQPQADNGRRACEAFFSPGEQCVRKIVNLIGCADETIEICVFTITDNRISDAILEAHNAGRNVRIVTDNDKSNDAGSDIYNLDRRGVPVRVDSSPYHMHHKFAIFDNRQVLTGSYNWTRGAANSNQENIVVSHEPQLLRGFQREFEKLWKAFA